jgi:hypothetical protein
MNARAQGGHPPFFHNADVICIDPADIFIPERIGFLHEDKAVALGRLMAVDGQRDPIKVAPHKGKQSWKLVTGRHRLRGAEIEGIQVYALEVGGDASDHADLEASENLHRRPLGPIERAKFTAALVQAAQERIAREHGDVSQHTLAAKARWDRVKHFEETVEGALRDETEDAMDKMSTAYSWKESAADALGLGKREVQRDLSLYRLLIEPFPELVEALSKHPVVGENASQLKQVAAVKDEGLRRKVIEALLADPEIGADDARIMAGVDRPEGAAATPVAHEKHFNALRGAWSRLGITEKRLYLPEFVSKLTPDLKVQLRAILDAEESA